MPGGLRGLLYPRRCPFCRRVLGTLLICPDCEAPLRALRRAPSMRLHEGEHYLGGLSGAAAPYRYAGLVRRAVLGAKYRGEPWAADALGEELARQLLGAPDSAPALLWAESMAQSYDCVIPVPASGWARGYNVPERMARPVARALGIPLEPKALGRTRKKRRQEGLSLDERLVNVAGVFGARQPARIDGQRVLLVDDVITTGATVSACTRALLDAGAQSVFAISLAAVEFGAASPSDAAILENADTDEKEIEKI